ncbi:UNVERIFIED_CONTAM: hypothetical protein GTU68_000903 [Idotea baltica]|nr:hypothetical protein [Idotea baltica]
MPQTNNETPPLHSSGSRYETIGNRGVSHLTRLCAGLSTQNFSAFGLTRKTQQLGGTLECQSGREHMSYSMSFLRDNLSEVFEMLSDSALHPLFHPWEVSAQSTRLLTEINARCPTVMAVEMLHEAAFRAEGLGNSLFVPDYRIGKVTPEQLQDFVKTTHTSSRLAFVGLGVEHGPLVKLARALKPGSGSGLKAPSAYGGGEIRRETGGPLAYVAVAGPGARVDSNDAASLAIAQFILGTGPGTKYGSNASSKLASVVSGAGGTGTALALNANYSDGGLFGFLVAEEADKAGDVSGVVRAVAKAIRSLKVTEEEVKNAKAKAKSAVLMSAESSGE